jgi:predicted HicB family RNase H-like nuclease
MEKKMGRPPIASSGAMGRVFQMRLTDADREAYEQAADRAGMTLSAWIRNQLGKAAKLGSKKP